MAITILKFEGRKNYTGLDRLMFEMYHRKVVSRDWFMEQYNEWWWKHAELKPYNL